MANISSYFGIAGAVSVMVSIVIFVGQFFVLSLQQLLGFRLLAPDFALTTGMPLAMVLLTGGVLAVILWMASYYKEIGE